MDDAERALRRDAILLRPTRRIWVPYRVTDPVARSHAGNPEPPLANRSDTDASAEAPTTPAPSHGMTELH